MRFRPIVFLAALSSLSAMGCAQAMTDAELQTIVGKRLHGDRTGACFATAVIDGEAVHRAYVCADGKDPAHRVGPRTAFEIGSVSKTMMAALLADLIREGKASLDDPLSAYLPADAKVPAFDGKPILLRHIVTHTSGLPAIPAGMEDEDPGDPYARLRESDLFDALAKTTLPQAPGVRFEYSNFASMLLSYAIARRADDDFEALLKTRLFSPLGMDSAYIGHPPKTVTPAVGHLPGGKITPAWTFHAEFAGVGGVRATLDDMVRYLQGHMGDAPAALDASLRLSRERVTTEGGQPMAMHWMLSRLGDRTFYAHEGGTGGFSSFVAFDPERKHGVIVLSDTALHSLGGLGDLGLHLLDRKMPLGKPRKSVKPPLALVDALVGDYLVQDAMKMQVRRKADTLEIQAEGQAAYELGYDDRGDFYPLQFDALLKPQKRADGSMGFVWVQMGGEAVARRVDAKTPSPALSAADLQAYVGEYPLMPGFALQVLQDNGRLMAQATGQGAFPLEAVAKDVFEFVQAGIVIRFRRDAAGKVVALTLEQAGQTMQGSRQ
jgi:serine-type D-Ala-D-Ala carboxypeptidase/endopeptidase